MCERLTTHQLFQLRIALDNHRRPARTPDARVLDAMRHAEQSNKKPAALAGANGLTNDNVNVRDKLWHKPG